MLNKNLNPQEQGVALSSKVPLELEEAWNVLTDDYTAVGINRDAVVVTTRIIPSHQEMRHKPQLVVVMTEGMGDRGPTGAPFIRKAEFNKRGDLCFPPVSAGSNPGGEVTTLLGFVARVVNPWTNLGAKNG